jgi:O-antigen ligase
MRGVNISSFRPFSMEKILGWVVTILAFIFPVAVLTVNRADSVILLLLGMIGTYAFLKHGIRYLALSRQEILLIGIFAGWYATIVLCYFVGDKTDTGFKLLGRNFRFLFFIPAFIACRCYLANTRALFSGLVLAPFAIFGLGLWQFISAHDQVRVSGFVDPIPFGDLSMAMAFMGLAILLVSPEHRSTWRYLLASGSLLAGVGASILSGTRGGWIALPVLLIITIVVLSRRSGKRAFKVFVASSAVVIIAGLLAPGVIIQNRAGEVVRNLKNYRVYVHLIDEGDVSRRGCLNSPLFMQALAKELQVHASSSLGATVVDDSPGLGRAGFRNQCQSGAVLALTNKNDKKPTTLVLKRSVKEPVGGQTAEFIVRGKGMISILRGIAPGWEKFNNREYALVEKAQDVKDLSWPAFWLPPGGTIYLVPVQHDTGEYIYPLANDSVGERFEMWRAAWQIFKRHILIGTGTGSFQQEVGKRVDAGDISPKVASFDHPHSDYMNNLSSWGLLGLAMYFLVLGYPLVLFMKALRSKRNCGKAAGFSGILMIVGLLIFGLTETMFIHSIVMSWYVTFTAMLMAIIFRQQDTEMRDVNI